MKDLIHDPALAGVIGLMVTGAGLYALRQIPVYLWRTFVWSATVRLTITGDDEAFDHVSEWLAGHAYARRARTLKLSTGRSGNDRWSLAPGFGTHVFWDNGLVILARRFDEKVGSGYQIRPKEHMTVTMIGRRQDRLRAMIEQANAKRISQDAVGVRVWTSGWWARLHSKGKRSLDTVFLPAEQKRAIVDGVQWFIDHPEWYAPKGIPYRYGLLLYGPPGTGKTTLALALSSYFNRPIFILNLATVQNDNELLQAFMTVAKGGIILIEDADAAQKNRAAAVEAPTVGGQALVGGAYPPLPPSPAPGITLSGLLNAIDGIAASEDRILIMTTNYVDRIDEALIRKGRIDARYEIGHLTAEQVGEMARAFFPNDRDTQVAAMNQLRIWTTPRPAAEWQGLFMGMDQARRPARERSAA